MRPALIAPFDRALLEPGASPGLQVVKTPPLDLRVATIGRNTAITAWRTPEAGEAPVAVEPDVLRRTLQEGGIVDIRAEGKPGDFTTVIKANAPAFDVFALSARREVVAWVHAWDSRAPVAKAEATLLLQRAPDAPLERIAQGQTDADGIALIVLPADFVAPAVDNDAPKPQWFVRVERSGQRALLPLQFGYGEPFATTKSQGFGVSDRPIYRAGDTVHWRLWSQAWRDGALVPAAPETTELALTEDTTTKIVTWTATFDASGSATGDTVLPVHLTDGDYCIGLATHDWPGHTARVCFFVGTYRAQDLWMRAHTPARVVRDGDTIPFDIEAGYYSGGVAAGARIDGIAATLEEVSLADAYPQWHEYTFSRWWRDYEEDGDLESLAPTTDDKGHARVSVPVAFKADERGMLPAFGRIRLSAEVQLSDRESTTSSPVEVLYSRYTRHVGLRVEPRWLDAKSQITLKAVVVDAEGKDVSSGSVDVEVFFSDSDDDDVVGEKVHSCVLTAGRSGDCTFARSRSGYYRFVAKQRGAAPAEFQALVWAVFDGGDDEEATIAFVEEEIRQPTPAGGPLRLPMAVSRSGPVLFIVSSDDRVLDVRVLQVDAGAQAIELPTQADWPRNGTVRAYLRGDASDKVLPAGYRHAVEILDAQTNFQLEATPRTDVPVTLEIDPSTSSPGGKVRVVLHNTSRAQRNVTLAIVDDALRAMGVDYLEGMDPQNMSALRGSSWDSMDESQFSGWNRSPLRWLLRRKEDVDICPRDTPDCFIKVMGSRINPIDVSSVESTTILTAEQLSRAPVSRDTTNVALLAPGTVRAPAPPPPAQRGDAYSELETVAVMGSSIAPPVAPDAPTPRDDRNVAVKNGDATISAPPIDTHRPAPELARIRMQFADTALWRSDIVLAPGETREIDFVAPDNLTRWRAVAWSDDGRSDIAMTDATLEAGLPVEARLQSPARIYPGDRARIATNVRQTATHAAQARALLKVQRGASNDTHAATLALPPQGQASFGVAIAPRAPGALLLTAAAATDGGQDAIALPLDVASTTITGRRTQAGWVGATPLALKLPTLPEGASDPHLRVSVWRGNDALVHGWTEDLRDYQHRCWEQILSRAVAAALAIERHDPAWPDAKAVVQEALDNAAVFQKYSGGMQFFANAPYGIGGNVSLTAYTVDAFALLRSLGYATPDFVESKARAFLTRDDEKDEALRNEHAIAAAVVDRPDDLDLLRKEHAKLALPARVAAVRALARAGDSHAAPATAALLEQAPLRGEARVLTRGADWSRWMSSPLREQCELIRLLQDFPQLAPAGTREALVRGLGDVYAGGVPVVDTQTGASCLRALRGERANDAIDVAVDATVGARSERLLLRNGEVRAEAAFDAPTADTLSMAAPTAPKSPVAYLARIDYSEDARQAQATAIGFSIERRYEVLRDHKWSPLGDAPLRDGDWVRITLVVSNAKTRHFVAVTDDLPGGLRPVDLALAGVAGVDMDALSSQGDGAFYERKLDPVKPKFYADRLWPGRHEIHYFTRVANSGDYLAAPAVAELMYGEATRARTAADRIRIADPAPTPDLNLTP